jgi:hypothetical protein
MKPDEGIEVELEWSIPAVQRFAAAVRARYDAAVVAGREAKNASRAETNASIALWMSRFSRLFAPSRNSTRPAVKAPPLHRLVLLINFFCSKRTRERVVNQTVADIRNEHCEAFAGGERWKARWIVVRGYWSVGTALGFGKILALIDKFIGRFVK